MPRQIESSMQKGCAAHSARRQFINVGRQSGCKD